MTSLSPMRVQELCKTAAKAAENAYAPYSNFFVGSAVLTDENVIFSGCNVENGSYGLTICAERIAIGKAVSEGHQRIASVAIATQNGVSPCGACRQVMHEFGSPECEIFICDAAGDLLRRTTLAKLLPESFDGPMQ